MFIVVLFLIFVTGCVTQELKTINNNEGILPLTIAENLTLNKTIIKNDIETEKIEVESLEDDDQFTTDELHWTHMPITFHILKPNHQLKDCGQYESNKIRKGFDRIEQSTFDRIQFSEIKNPEDADIVVRCSYIKDCYKLITNITENFIYTTENICEHAKGFANITEYEGNKILKAEIGMVGLFGFSETRNKGTSGFYFASCGHPSTEIHEILHTFGYGHDLDNPESIMYFQDDVMGYTKLRSGDCYGSRKLIDDWIVDDLIKTYSK